MCVRANQVEVEHQQVSTKWLSQKVAGRIFLIIYPHISHNDSMLQETDAMQ